MRAEENRIKAVYEKRRIEKGGLYSSLNKGHVFMRQELEQGISKLLMSNGIDSIASKTILDIGCGSGDKLGDLLKFGARPENLSGIDLLDWRVDDARRILPPGVRLECGNAEKLSFSDRSFDVVIQFTVFSSILDPHMKRNVASEMLRVLKEDGFVIWYDFFVRDPRNSDVRAITKNEIRQLFPGCQIDLRRITVAAPLVRLLAPYSWRLCYLLERIKVLDTHYLGLIRKSSV